VAEGHAARGTTRSREKLATIEASGAEAAIADPDRLGTLLTHVEGASVICWLMGSVSEGSEIHGPRLCSFLDALVDTPVRGFVYEAAGSAREGTSVVLAAGEDSRMPVELVGTDPSDQTAWLSAMTAAVGRVLG
jgi:hypothetical protein